VICKAKFNNEFCYFRYEGKVTDWTAVRELIFVYGIFLEKWRHNRFVENGVELTISE